MNVIIEIKVLYINKFLYFCQFHKKDSFKKQPKTLGNLFFKKMNKNIISYSSRKKEE